MMAWLAYGIRQVNVWQHFKAIAMLSRVLHLHRVSLKSTIRFDTITDTVLWSIWTSDCILWLPWSQYSCLEGNSFDPSWWKHANVHFSIPMVHQNVYLNARDTRVQSNRLQWIQQENMYVYFIVLMEYADAFSIVGKCIIRWHCQGVVNIDSSTRRDNARVFAIHQATKNNTQSRS